MQMGMPNISFTALLRKAIQEETPPGITNNKEYRRACASNGNEFWVTEGDIAAYDSIMPNGIRYFGTQAKIDEFIREHRDGTLE